MGWIRDFLNYFFLSHILIRPNHLHSSKRKEGSIEEECLSNVSISNAFSLATTIKGVCVMFLKICLFLSSHIFQEIYLGRACHIFLHRDLLFNAQGYLVCHVEKSVTTETHDGICALRPWRECFQTTWENGKSTHR